jgi:hypothetical protein
MYKQESKKWFAESLYFCWLAPGEPVVLSNSPEPKPQNTPPQSAQRDLPATANSLDNEGALTVEVVGTQLASLQQKMNRLHRTVRLTIEAELASFAGLSFGTLAANEEVVAMIHDVLESHGLRVQCPECGHPAILRCSGRPGVASGVFVLDHSIEGRRTFHGGYSALPELRLVAKPRRRGNKKKAS